MAARGAVVQLLRDDSDLNGLGLQQVYAANAVDTPSEDFFLVVKWDSTVGQFKTFGSDQTQIWAHDKNRDYGRINSALQRIKDLLTDAVHYAGEDGWTLTTAEWLGEGPDLFDSGYGTCTRYADFTIVSRLTN